MGVFMRLFLGSMCGITWAVVLASVDSRERSEEDARLVHIYATEEGEKLSTAHKLFDNMDIMQTQRDLLQECTIEDVDAFYKVLNVYLKLFDE